MEQILGPRQPSFLKLRTINWIVRPLEMLDIYAKRYGEPFSIGGDNLPLSVYFSHPEALLKPERFLER